MQSTTSTPDRHPDFNLPVVILNLYQDNRRRLFVILKQVQDDESGGIRSGEQPLIAETAQATLESTPKINGSAALPTLTVVRAMLGVVDDL